MVDFIGSPNHFIGLKVSVLLSGAAGVLLWLLQTADDMSTNEWRRQNYFISHRQVSIVNCRQFVAVLSIYHLIQVDSVLIFAQVQSQDQLLCSGFSAWHWFSLSDDIRLLHNLSVTNTLVHQTLYKWLRHDASTHTDGWGQCKELRFV